MVGSLCCFVCLVLRSLTFALGSKSLWTWTIANRCSCQLFSAHLSTILVTEALGNIFCWFGGVIILGVSITVCDVASSRRCLQVANDTIKNILAIYVGVPGFLFLSFVALAVVLFAVPFHGVFGVCSVDHQIYADCVLDSFLHDGNGLGSNTYYSVGPNRREWSLEQLSVASSSPAVVLSG